MNDRDTLSTSDLENTAKHPEHQSAKQLSMLAVVGDLANLFTLAGLLSGVLEPLEQLRKVEVASCGNIEGRILFLTALEYIG